MHHGVNRNNCFGNGQKGLSKKSPADWTELKIKQWNNLGLMKSGNAWSCILEISMSNMLKRRLYTYPRNISVWEKNDEKDTRSALIIFLKMAESVDCVIEDASKSGYD